MDPVTHFSQSPYVSMDADPINLYDPNGADVFSDIGDAVSSVGNWIADAATDAYNGVSDLLTGTDDNPLEPRSSGLIDDIGDAIGSVEVGTPYNTQVVPEPEQDNAAISMPSVRPEYEFMANWEYQINSYLYSNDPVFFAVGAVNAMIYTTLDVLMISWTNQAHYWGLNALPARNLKGEFVNNIAVQDAFGGVAGLAVMGLEARLLRMPPTKEVTDVILKSFDDVIANPKALWGKSADEVGSILGEGWTKGAYGSSKTGWKFTRAKDGQSIFYHPGGGKHGGSYYGFSSGTHGKTKVVGSDYIPLKGDKANIIMMGD